MRNLFIVLAPGLRQEDLSHAGLPTATRWAHQGLCSAYVDLPLPAAETTVAALLPDAFWRAAAGTCLRWWNWDPGHPGSLFLPFSQDQAQEVESWLLQQPDPFVAVVNANPGVHRWGVDRSEWERGRHALDQWLALWERALQVSGRWRDTVLLLTSPFGRTAAPPTDGPWLREPEQAVHTALAGTGLAPVELEVRPRLIWVGFGSHDDRDRALQLLLQGEEGGPFADLVPGLRAGQPGLWLPAPARSDRCCGYLPEADARLPDWMVGGAAPAEGDVPLVVVGADVPRGEIPFFRWQDVAPTLCQWVGWQWDGPGTGQAYPQRLAQLPVALRYAPAWLEGEEQVENWPLHRLPAEVRSEVLFAARRRWRGEAGEIALLHLFTLSAPALQHRWELSLERQGCRQEGSLWRGEEGWWLVQASGFLLLVGESHDPAPLLRLRDRIEQGYEKDSGGVAFPLSTANEELGLLWGDGRAYSGWSVGHATVSRRAESWRSAGLGFGVLTDRYGPQPTGLTPEAYRRVYVPQVLAQLDERLLSLPGVELHPPLHSANRPLLAWFVADLESPDRLELLCHRGLAQWAHAMNGQAILVQEEGDGALSWADTLDGLLTSLGEAGPRLMGAADRPMWLAGGSGSRGLRLAPGGQRLLVWSPERSPNGLRWALEHGRTAVVQLPAGAEGVLLEPLLRVNGIGPGGECRVTPGSQVDIEWGAYCGRGLATVELWVNGSRLEEATPSVCLFQKKTRLEVRGSVMCWLQATARGGAAQVVTSPLRVVSDGEPPAGPEPPCLYPGIAFDQVRGDRWELLPMLVYNGDQINWPVVLCFTLREAGDERSGPGRAVAQREVRQDSWHPRAFNALPSVTLPLPPLPQQEGEGEPCQSAPVLELHLHAARPEGAPVPLVGTAVTPSVRGQETAVRLAVLRAEWGVYTPEREEGGGGEFLFRVERALGQPGLQGPYVGGWHWDPTFEHGSLTYQWIGRLPVAGIRACRLVPGWDYRVTVDAYFLQPLGVTVYWNSAHLAEVSGEGGPVRWQFEVPGTLVGEPEEYLLFDSPRWYPHESPQGALREVCALRDRRQPVSFAIARIHLMPLRFNPRPIRGSGERIAGLEWER